MSRIVPLGSIPRTTLFPDGSVLRLRVDELTETLTKEQEGKTQKFMLKLASTVVAPEAFKGLKFTEFFTIGTDEDPDAELLETWQKSIGGKQFARFTDKVGTFGDEEKLDALIATIKGQEYLVSMALKTEPARKKINGVEQDNPYAGRVNNNVSAYWKIGEREPALPNGHATATPPPARAAAPTRTAAKTPPSDEVTCTACRKRVKRAELQAHVNAHMEEMSRQGATTGSDE